MTFRSAILTTLTADVENDINDSQHLVPVLQEVDTILASFEARITALESS